MRENKNKNKKQSARSEPWGPPSRLGLWLEEGPFNKRGGRVKLVDWGTKVWGSPKQFLKPRRDLRKGESG